jgi:ribonuclease HI
MELFAIIKALEFIHHNESKSMPYRYEVFSDSAYIINCLHQKWYQKWQKNGWITSKNKPVKNKDLWKKLLALLGKTPIEFIKIKAHAGHQYNELADHLAVEAIAKFTKNT